MRKYFKLLIALTLLISCSSACRPRVELNAKQSVAEETKETKGDNATLIFSASFGDHLKSLRSYPTEQDAPKYRLSFNGIRAVLYAVDPETKKADKVAYAFDWDVTADKGKISGKDLKEQQYKDGHHTLLLQGEKNIKVGNYKLYLFATPSKQLKEATTVGKPFAELNKAIDISDLCNERDQFLYGYYSTKTPMDITAEALLENGNLHRYKVESTELTADHALASVTWQPTLLNKEYTLYDKAIFLIADVMNKKFFLFPEKDPAETRFEYPKDPNYQGYAGKSIDDLKSDFFYAKDNPTTNNTAIFLSSAATGTEYNNYIKLPENTVATNETLGKLTTRIIVQAIIVPKSISLGTDPKATNGNATYTWLLYKGKPYSIADFGKLYDKAVTKKENEKTPEDKDVIRAGKSIIDHYNKYTQLRASYNKSSFDKIKGSNTTDIPGLKTDLVRYYHMGRNYFSIPIRHVDDTKKKDSKQLGRYGVLRGHHYQINISKFDSYGEPSITALSRDIDYNAPAKQFSSSVAFKDFHPVKSSIEL